MVTEGPVLGGSAVVYTIVGARPGGRETLDRYSHVFETMQVDVAAAIGRLLGGEG